jgi:hypothetical protein
VAHIAKNGKHGAEAYSKATSLIMQAIRRLAIRERVERRVIRGHKKPKRTPFLEGEPPFVRHFETMANQNDPFVRDFLDHPEIKGAEENITALLQPVKGSKVSRMKILIFLF